MVSERVCDVSGLKIKNINGPSVWLKKMRSCGTSYLNMMSIFCVLSQLGDDCGRDKFLIAIALGVKKSLRTPRMNAGDPFPDPI